MEENRTISKSVLSFFRLFFPQNYISSLYISWFHLDYILYHYELTLLTITMDTKNFISLLFFLRTLCKKMKKWKHFGFRFFFFSSKTGKNVNACTFQVSLYFSEANQLKQEIWKLLAHRWKLKPSLLKRNSILSLFNTDTWQFGALSWLESGSQAP